jgi:hypothetical protein
MTSWCTILLENLNCEVPYLMWNLRIHYPVHKRPLLVCVLSQMSPVTIFHPVSLRPILMLSSHLHFIVSCMLCVPPSSSSSCFLPTFRVTLPFAPQAQQFSSVEHQHLPVTAALLSTIIKVTLSTYFCHVLCTFVALKM